MITLLGDNLNPGGWSTEDGARLDSSLTGRGAGPALLWSLFFLRLLRLLP